MRHSSQPNNEGYIVLITILIIGVVATTIGLFLLITGTDAGLASAGVEAKAQARASSLACAELALGSIQSDPTLTTPLSGSSILDNNVGSQCNYDITGSSPNYTISSTGTVRASSDNYVHHMSITINQVAPKLTVSSWQDTP